jgi:hypothetical protein
MGMDWVPLGDDFCRTCLMTDTTVMPGLPQHSAPPEKGKTAQPPSEPA